MTTYTVPARIVRVVDGDTIRCDLDLGWGMWLMNEPIRLARINAPEMTLPAGKAAAQFLGERLLSAMVATKSDLATFTSTGFDKYRRALGELVVPPIGNLSELMLASGHAVVYGEAPVSPPKPSEGRTSTSTPPERDEPAEDR